MVEVAQKVGKLIKYRFTEVLLTAFLTIAISVFSFGIRAQVVLQETTRQNSLEIARNEERIEAASKAAIAAQLHLIEKIDALGQLSDKGDSGLIQQLTDLSKRLDQRFDALEQLIHLKGEVFKDTGGN